jgi:hypothetical protein
MLGCGRATHGLVVQLVRVVASRPSNLLYNKSVGDVVQQVVQLVRVVEFALTALRGLLRRQVKVRVFI